MRNKVTSSAFLNWYFSDSSDIETLGQRAVSNLFDYGAFFITPLDLFIECGYIPQSICVDSDGNEEYSPSEVEFIAG